MEEDKKIVKIFMVLTVLSIIVALVLIVMIWKTNSFSNTSKIESSIENVEVGEFLYNNYNLEYAIKSYSDKICQLLKSAEVEELYNNYLSESYKSYYNLSEQDFYNNLMSKGLIGRNLLVTEYFNTNINGKRIFFVKFITENKTASSEITIIEDSPEVFKIAFDGFISQDSNPIEKNEDGVKLQIKTVTYFKDRIIYKGSLTNLNSYVLYGNTEHKYENMYLRFNDDNEFVTKATILSGNSFELTNGASLAVEINVDMNASHFKYIKKIVFKDMRFSENGPLTELVYEI